MSAPELLHVDKDLVRGGLELDTRARGFREVSGKFGVADLNAPLVSGEEVAGRGCHVGNLRDDRWLGFRT